MRGLTLIKVISFGAIITVYLAAIVLVAALTHANLDAIMGVAFIGGMVVGGALLGIGVIDE